MAMEAAAKRASLENMVKMKKCSERERVFGFWLERFGMEKTKLVNRLKKFTLTLDRLYRFFGLPFWVNLFWRDPLNRRYQIDHRLICWPPLPVPEQSR